MAKEKFKKINLKLYVEDNPNRFPSKKLPFEVYFQSQLEEMYNEKIDIKLTKTKDDYY